jgi:hypothetical protein
MRADQAASAFSDIGRKSGDIYQCCNLRVVSCLSDGHAAPTVTDENDRTFGVRDDTIRGSEIIFERRERKGHGDNPLSFCQ